MKKYSISFQYVWWPFSSRPVMHWIWHRKIIMEPEILERSFPAQSIHVGSARPIKKLLWHVLHLGRTPRRHTTCGHLLAEHQLELCRYPVTEYLGRYSRHIQLERTILSYHASKPFYPRSRKWVYVSGWCDPEPVFGTSVWHESPVLLHAIQNFRGVPLITKVDILDGKPSADKFYVERATPEATMEFIKADINKSENYFGNNTSFDAYDWSRYATLMLKAEIYMWAAKVSITGFTATGATDLQTAKTALSGIIGHFELMDNFASIFSCDNKKNAEIIFAMPFVEGEASNDGSRFLYRGMLYFWGRHMVVTVK